MYILRPVPSVPEPFRIDELARRVGAGPDLLLACRERLHGLPRPVRSAGGFRLLEDAAVRVLAATRDYDEAGVQAVLDESFAAFGAEAALRGLIPLLARPGASDARCARLGVRRLDGDPLAAASEIAAAG
jgi:hypothetical protein